jgi:hypothetical protein
VALDRVTGLPWLPGALVSGAILLALGVAFGRWYVRRASA